MIVSLLATLVACGESEAYPAQVRPFCEVAVTALDGKTPDPQDMGRIEALAAQVLPKEDAQRIIAELELLRSDLQADSAPGYSTVAVTELVGTLCNAPVRAIISNPPLVGVTGDDPPEPHTR
jgi:hypothetical protein